MRYRRMPIEVESPEQLGYDTITNNLSESSVADRRLRDFGVELGPGGGGAAARRRRGRRAAGRGPGAAGTGGR